MHLLIILSLLATAACKFEPTTFATCDRLTKVVSAVWLDPCVRAKQTDKCPLVKGGNSTLKFTFTPKSNTNTLVAKVHGKIGAVPFWIPFPIPVKNVCTKYGVECPVHAEREYTFHYAIPVSHFYPSVNVVVKWELIGDKGKKISCLEVETFIK